MGDKPGNKHAHKGVVDRWLNANNPGLCACGCGGPVSMSRRKHCKSVGIPRYIHGHFKREGLAPETIQWVTDQQGKHICACGCNRPIHITHMMKRPSVGIPKYIRGHSRRKHPFAAHRRNNWTVLYRQWRDEVIQRKGRDCEKCGKKTQSGRGKDSLHVHHDTPEQELFKRIERGEIPVEVLSDPSIGVVLCGACHFETHVKLRSQGPNS